MTNLSKKLDKKLMKISNEQMKYFAAYRKKGNIVATKIFKVLTIHSKAESIAIARCLIAGSIGKRSSLGVEHKPDFDLVVFINGEKPPFETVLPKLEKILSEKCSVHGLHYKFHKSTKHSLKFHITDAEGNYINFDLLPASNLLPSGASRASKAEKVQLQTESALIHISKLEKPEKNSSLYGSSLADRSVSFTKKQSPFVHNMIRLCKWWNCNIKYFQENYLYGRSTMVELVAIFVGNEEEEVARKAGTRPKISCAFVAFLKKFINFDDMDVFFDFPCNPNQQQLYDVYKAKLKEHPLILDPVNPYNNLADVISKDEDAKKAFALAAEHTLEEVQNRKAFVVPDLIEFALLKIN